MSAADRTETKTRSIGKCTYGKCYVTEGSAFRSTTGYSFTAPKMDGGTETVTQDLFNSYYKRKKKGEILMGDLELYRSTRVPGSGGGIVNSPDPAWGWETVYGDLAAYLQQPVVDLPTGLLTTLQNLSVTKAFSKVDTEGVMSSEYLGEMSQIIGMLRRPLSGARDNLRRFYRKYHDRTRWSKSKDLAKIFSSTWLEYSYGWSPLASDVAAVAQKFTAKQNESRLRVVRSLNKWSSHKETTVIGLPPRPPRLDAVAVHDRGLRVSAGVMYNINDDPSNPRLDQFFGLRAQDMASAAWELTPYSFVVDWFVNIGDWVKAFTPKPGINVLGSWLTTVDEEVVKYRDIKGVYVFGTKTGYIPFVTSETRNLSINRVGSPGIPRTPTLNTNFSSWAHTASAISLIAQQIKSDAANFRR